MRRINKRGIVLFAFLFIVTIDSFACTCIGSSTVKNNCENSNLILIGQVLCIDTLGYSDTVAVVNKDKNLYIIDDFTRIKYTVKKIKIYKGCPVSDTIYIYTPSQASLCGCVLGIKQQYIFYAKKLRKVYAREKPKQAFFFTDICMGTKPYNIEENKELERLFHLK